MECGKVSFKQAIHDYFHGLISFGGRTTRAGYWKSKLLVILINIVAVAMIIGLGACIYFATDHLFMKMLASTSDARGLAAMGLFSALMFMIILGPGLLIIGLMIPLIFANWAVLIRRLRDVGLRLKTIIIGYGLMGILDIIINTIFIANYGFGNGLLWSSIWNLGINLIIQIIFLCLPSGAMATQKKNSKFFESKSTF